MNRHVMVCGVGINVLVSVHDVRACAPDIHIR